jgi:glycosyltransferase involved in cell wall biosynthesis
VKPEANTPGSGKGTPLSACVITYQEEDHIADCLRSLSFCDEILVVDSGSTDRTAEIATELGARVIVNTPFPGHREQKQFAVEHACHDWVLSLDADERVTADLRGRVLGLQREGFPGHAYAVMRRNCYLGRFIRRGMFGPEAKVRLFDRRHAHWAGMNPHDRIELQNGARVVRLGETLEHHTHTTVKEHLRQIDLFARLDAQAKHAGGRRATVLDLLFRPATVVGKSLFLQGGFLEGWRGFVIAGLGGYYSWLKCWRLRRLNRR